MTDTVPFSIHREAITKFHAKGETDEAIDTLADAVSYARTISEDMVAAHKAIMSNPLGTRLQNMKRSAKLAFEAHQKAARVMDRARAKAKAEIEALEDLLRGPKVSDKHAEEFRRLLAGLDPKARNALLAKAVVEGEDELVGAALNSPSPFLLGMGSKVELETVRANWQRRSHPKDLERIGRLQKAMDAFGRASNLLTPFLLNLNPRSEIEEAERLQAVAQEAAEKVA